MASPKTPQATTPIDAADVPGGIPGQIVGAQAVDGLPAALFAPAQPVLPGDAAQQVNQTDKDFAQALQDAAGIADHHIGAPRVGPNGPVD